MRKNLFKIFINIIIICLSIASVIILNSCNGDNKLEDGLYPMYEKYDTNELWGYIDENGQYVIEPQYLYADYFYKDLAVVRDTDNYLYGYIDKKGEYVIYPQFLYAYNFAESDITAVDVGDDITGLGKWGYIDKNGNYVIAPQFNSAGLFFGNYACVTSNDDSYYDDEYEVTVYNDFMIDRDLVRYEFDTDSRTEKDRTKVWNFSNGPQLVYDIETGYYGYVDKNNKFVIKPDKKWSYAPFTFSEGVCFYRDKETDLYGVIDEEGKIIIEPRFSECKLSYNNGVALVEEEKEELYGYIAKKGNGVYKKEMKE